MCLLTSNTLVWWYMPVYCHKALHNFITTLCHSKPLGIQLSCGLFVALFCLWRSHPLIFDSCWNFDNGKIRICRVCLALCEHVYVGVCVFGWNIATNLITVWLGSAVDIFPNLNCGWQAIKDMVAILDILIWLLYTKAGS